MSGKKEKRSFEDIKINKINFCKNKRLFKIEDIDINNRIVSKKNHTAQKIHINTLLYIMMMMPLNLYV